MKNKLDKYFAIGISLFTAMSILRYVFGITNNLIEFFCGMGTALVLLGIARMLLPEFFKNLKAKK